MITVHVDPYASLAYRHKLPYTYTFVTDFYGVEFLVREQPRSHYFNDPDPQFKSLTHPDWKGEEFQVGDVFPPNSIVTPISMSRYIRKNMSDHECVRVSTFEDIVDEAAKLMQ